MPSSAEAIAWLKSLPTRGAVDTLGIEVIELTPERTVATMPVDNRTHQPFGILHGGASVALAETVASLGGAMHIDRERFVVVGLEINANHLRPVREGVVKGIAVPVHIGRTTQVWSIEIVDKQDQKVCVSRCTLAVVPKERT